MVEDGGYQTVRCEGSRHRILWNRRGALLINHGEVRLTGGSDEHPSTCGKRVAEWLTAGAAVTEVGGWIRAGFRRPSEAQRWLRRALAPSDAREWIDSGLDLYTIDIYSSAGLSFRVAQPWIDVDWHAVEAATLAKSGLMPEEARKMDDLFDSRGWHRRSRMESIALIAACGMRAAEAAPWAEAGFDANDTADYVSGGVDLETAKAWRDEGFRSVLSVKECIRSQVPLNVASELLKLGVMSLNVSDVAKAGWTAATARPYREALPRGWEDQLDAVLLAGLSVSDLQAWHGSPATYWEASQLMVDAGLSATEARRWFDVGAKRAYQVLPYIRAQVGPDAAKPWISLGFDASEAAELIRKGVGFDAAMRQFNRGRRSAWAILKELRRR